MEVVWRSGRLAQNEDAKSKKRSGEAVFDGKFAGDHPGFDGDFSSHRSHRHRAAVDLSGVLVMFEVQGSRFEVEGSRLGNSGCSLTRPDIRLRSQRQKES